MARNADIRVWLSSVLPTEDLTVVTSVLKDIITQAEALAEHVPNVDAGFEIYIVDHTRLRASFEIQLVNKEKFSILPNDETYFMGDVKKALEEFTYQETLSDEVGTPFFIDNYFNRLNQETTDLLGGPQEVGALGGRIHAAIMKRFYNWGRCGYNNPIIISHTLKDETVATVTIPKLELREVSMADTRYGDLSSAILVSQNSDVIYKGKFTTFVKQPETRKPEELYKEEFELVKEIINRIPVNRHEFDQFHLLSQMVETLSTQTTEVLAGECEEVNLAIDRCQWNMVGEVTVKEKTIFVDLTMAHIDPTEAIHNLTDFWKIGTVSLTKLITGLNVYRQVHAVPPTAYSVGNFEDLENAAFLSHRELAEVLEETLIEQGHDTDTVKGLSCHYIDLGDIKLFYKGPGDNTATTYAITHRSFTTLYTFDAVYDIQTLNLPAPIIEEEAKPAKPGFFGRLRGLFSK